MNCPVCLLKLTQPIPLFCPVCAWDFETDLTLAISLSPIPDARFDIYRRRLELFRRNREELMQRNQAVDAEQIAKRMILYEQSASGLFETYRQTNNEQYLQLAIDQFTAALEENPNFKQGWLNIGNFYRRKNDMNNARLCYQRALDIDPEYSLAKDNLDSLPG